MSKEKLLEEFDKLAELISLHSEKCFGHQHERGCKALKIKQFLLQTIDQTRKENLLEFLAIVNNCKEMGSGLNDLYDEINNKIVKSLINK